MATQVVIDEQAVETSLSDSTVILNLEMGKVTNRRKIKSDSEHIQTDIDRDSLHVGIDLFDAPELRACQNFQAQLKQRIIGYCVPSFFRGGMFLVKLEAVQQVNDIIKQAIVDFVPIVTAFADVVDQRRDEARERLKGEWKPQYYPTREQVMSIYRIEHHWLSMATPTSLKRISVDLFNSEKKKAEDTLRAATDNITAMLAAEAQALGDHLVERLTPDDDGRAKQIRKASVANIVEFLSTFSLRNIGSNDELTVQMDRIKKLVEGVDVKELRTNEQLREDLRTQFKSVSEALDGLIIKPKRFMSKEE